MTIPFDIREAEVTNGMIARSDVVGLDPLFIKREEQKMESLYVISTGHGYWSCASISFEEYAIFSNEDNAISAALLTKRGCDDIE